MTIRNLARPTTLYKITACLLGLLMPLGVQARPASAKTAKVKSGPSSSGSRTFSEARITVYWQDSDAWTRALQSSTGVRLKNKQHVAVDPALIPYGSKVKIHGWGTFTAVDTGGAVKKRTAARRMGRNVPVVDVFFISRKEALRAAETNPSFSKVEVLPARS